MNGDGKLMEMLVGYASAHQHPVNIFVHLLGIPTIILGVLIAASWVDFGLSRPAITLAHVLVAVFFVAYLTLDRMFALMFLVLAVPMTMLASYIASLPIAISATVAAAAFFGGYALQFVGHAVEKSMPVLVKHPVQANLAAPFFTMVELSKLLGLRRDLFDAVQREVAARRRSHSSIPHR